MNSLSALINRNTKLFFKDKGMFFTALITPLILLVLYATFLAKVYRDSFSAVVPEMIKIEDSLLDAMVGGQLISSLLSVCCVTVAFCSNFLMVQDKVNGSAKDLFLTPVKKSTMAMGYYISTLFSTLIIALFACAAGFIYLKTVGWFLSLSDVLFILLDVFLLVTFGTALSSVINFFLTSQGQISAVGTVVSAGYGFISGAYMPISQFGEGLQKILMFLPGTYATSLLRNHCLNGVFREMKDTEVPQEVIDALRDTVDCNIYFFDNKVSINTMLLILGGGAFLVVGVYIILNAVKIRGKNS